MKKGKSVWVYYSVNAPDELYDRLIKKAVNMGGEYEGGGVCLGQKPERDVSFGFSDPHAARRFSKLVRKWKSVHRIETVTNDE